jgi:hypothetical protein
VASRIELVKALRASSKLVVIAALIAAGVAEYMSLRNKAMERLYLKAAGYPPYWRSSKGAVTAVNKLANYEGDRSTKMLLDIALGDSPLVSDARDRAIAVLADRKDPEIAAALATRLQPHEGLETRRGVAAALQTLPCQGGCVRSILHYLERVYCGEPNYEDRMVPVQGFEAATNSLREDQESLYTGLYSILRREKKETFANLAEVYGLGSVAPSAFSIALASRLGLHDACPYLLRSEEQIKELSPDAYRAPRQELQHALTSLKCRQAGRW